MEEKFQALVKETLGTGRKIKADLYHRVGR